MKSFIFLNNIKKNAFLSFNNITNDIKFRHIPSVSKEWKDNIYSFNFFNTKNLPVIDYIADKLIAAYFNSCFQIGKYKVKLLRTNKKLWRRRWQKKTYRLTRTNKGFTKIFISKSELNYNNHVVTVNLYIFNKKGVSLFRKIKKTKLKSKKFFKKFLLLSAIWKKNLNILRWHSPRSFKLRKKRFKFLYLFISYLEKLKMKFSLNEYKFEEKLLYLLASILTKFYKKKIEFNIINLKSIAFNSDIFTNILTLKSKFKRINPHRVMKYIFNKAFIPRTDKLTEKTAKRKEYLKEWQVKTRQINKKLSLIKEQFDYSSYISNYYNQIYKFYTNINQRELYEKIFNSIHYKNIGGIRLEIKGRLTWRYRAERAKYKLRKKGGIRNIESSYKRLRTIMRRGNKEYNFRYSIFNGKRRIGAFAVKGWIAGK